MDKRQFNRVSVISAALLLVGVFTLSGCDGNCAQGLAAVNKTGTLLRGVNVASVTLQPPGYRVEFNSSVDVSNGYYLVTPGLTGSCNSKPNAEKGAGNSVYVSFAKSGDTPSFVNCGFSLAVFQ